VSNIRRAGGAGPEKVGSLKRALVIMIMPMDFSAHWRRCD